MQRNSAARGFAHKAYPTGAWETAATPDAGKNFYKFDGCDARPEGFAASRL